MNTTEAVAKYISDNNLSILQIVKDTQIQEEKLRIGTKEKLSAQEFLELCDYLNITPEELMEKYL